jgi:hypothetical protein
VIGVNMLYDNKHDLKQGDFHRTPTSPLTALPGLRLYGLHGNEEPNGRLRANPGTLFEWHDEPDKSDDGKGALYVKERGSDETGWVKVAGHLEDPGHGRTK